MDCKKALEENGRQTREGRRVAALEGRARRPRSARDAQHPMEGVIAQLRAPQRQDRRAGRAELRDGLRGAQRGLPAARQVPRRAHRRGRPDRRSTRSRIPQEKIDSERRIVRREQVKAEGKPDHLIDKIVEGKVQAFYQGSSRCCTRRGCATRPRRVGDLVKEVVGARRARTSRSAGSCGISWES